MLLYFILGLLFIFNIIAIILGVYSLIKREEEYYNKEDIVLILTSTINIGDRVSYLLMTDPGERLKIYEKAINSWINDSSFKIVLVENSGHKFENLPKDPRLEIISYTPEGEDKKKLDKHADKGAHELHSINYAIKNSKIIKNMKDGFVIKITGRYYIPNFEKILKDTITDSTEFITQNNRMRCEIIGCKLNLADKLFEFKMIGQMEADMKKLIDKLGNEKTINKLPKIPIPPTLTGGWKKFTNFL